MAERGAESGIQPPQTFIGSVFETGRSRMVIHEYIGKGRDVVPIERIEDPKGRENWLFENMRVFNDGTVAQPEASWKGIVDFHLSELFVAEKNAIREGKPVKREDVEKTEKYLKAAMAISASARAMEASSGVPAAYECYITQSAPRPNPDRQDSWAEFLLHKDPMKIKTALSNEMVNNFYKMIIDDAGMGEVLERNAEGNFKFNGKGRFIVDWDKFNVEKALKGQLIGFLIDKIPSPLNKYEECMIDWENKHLILAEEKEKLDEDGKPKEVGKKWKSKSSLYDYIWEVLLDEKNIKKLSKREKDIPFLWSAARLAADIFLVDKFTKWDHELSQAFPEKKQPRIKPSKGWGGDPLKSIIAPSFLPSVVKKVYSKDKAAKAIAELIDEAFRPGDLDLIDKDGKPMIDKDGKPMIDKDGKPMKVEVMIDDKLPCSMICPLKSFDRYNEALWVFLGAKSRAPGVAKWDRQTMEESLPLIVEKLDDVYGKFQSEGKNDETFSGELMGLIMTRILYCKALAAAYQSARPGFSEVVDFIGGDLKSGKSLGRPFYEVEKFIWGPDLKSKSGFLSELVGPRTRFIFDKQNRFNTEKILDDTWEILFTNDQDPKGRGRAKTMNVLAHITDFLQAVGHQLPRK